MSRSGGLGRGLGALIPQGSAGQSGLVELTLDQLKPNARQPRDRFDEAALEELTHSIATMGILQPIVARPLPDGSYEIVAGERRFRAARRAGLARVPVVIRHTEDDQLLTEALVENIHRADLDPIEEARAYRQLIDDFEFTHDDLAERLGRSRSVITNTLRLLTLVDSVADLVSTGAISAGHGRSLAVLEADQQQAIANQIVTEGLSVRRTEELVKTITEPRRQVRSTQGTTPSVFTDVEDQLADRFGTKVNIQGSPRRGRIQIEYAGSEDFHRLLGLLMGE
ncbi:ParB/RepB/Spo0J family partition protein [Stomatohabitans albus]|uniref:ParB/RepB/Spo0J family partition protein n=1 Tax=Stomatohabitans albus TaxID=3110766 RepID=UPI00300D981F